MELSLEEKKAKEYIKEFRNEVFEGVGNKSIMAKNIDILLNLVENQQKEIEDLKQIDKHITKETVEFVNSHYISKNEIGEKIKKYQEKAEDVKQKYKGVYAYKDDYLEALAKIEGYQELLEENTK